MRLPSIAFVAAALGFSLPIGAANITPYYLFDGDFQQAWEISNGLVTNTFSIFRAGYPVAIRSSIWLGDLEDRGATEYTLDGIPTGRDSVGGGNFSQLLDGATGSNNRNYGIECCGVTNSVTVAERDWSNQRVLFDLVVPDGTQCCLGIAYDPTDDSLFVALAYPNDPSTWLIAHYGMDGTLLGRFDTQLLVGLAYEQATDTFWGFNRDTVALVQFDRTGAVLQEVPIPNFPVDISTNPWGGEMPFSDVAEPGSLALLGLGLATLAVVRRRDRSLHRRLF